MYNIIITYVYVCVFDATIPSSAINTEVSKLAKNGFYRRAYLRKYIPKWNISVCILFPTSFAITKGILVSFYYCAALTDMFKFSAYPYSSWCALCVCVWYMYIKNIIYARINISSLHDKRYKTVRQFAFRHGLCEIVRHACIVYNIKYIRVCVVWEY